ncbi:MAG: hypothetical protein QG622_68 [Actinomycetota bacterium]|nr:hypothetical protein [Actinomycetota bacterium]
MARGLSYSDAVTLLGAPGQVAEAMDRLTGGLLLAGAAAGSPFALALFDPKNELSRLSGQLVSGSVERLRGLTRFDRSQRVAAAHSVLVMASYLDAVAAADLPFRVREADLRPEDLLEEGPSGRRLVDLADSLLRSRIPVPTPDRSFEDVLAELRGFYRRRSDRMVSLLSGLVVWDRLDETARGRVARVLADDVPGAAITRYEDAVQRLAVQVPEVAFWSNRMDHLATRYAVKDVVATVSRLEQLVGDLANGRVPDERRAELHRFYQAPLRRPILHTGEAPEGIRLPTLGDAFIWPDFRVSRVGASDDLVHEAWWQRLPVRQDLWEFLIGYLTGIRAVRAPLLVLGQPGSGKSVLTRILAAQLPPEDYLVVRVPLRDVPADVELQAQIEAAIYASTGDRLSWPQLARSRGDALPLILLDGFDELLQATGTHQTDYVEKIARFQQREAELGRPLAVILTTRTAVSDRARCSPGTLALRVEPFRREQVECWVSCWNATNAPAFAEGRLRPLDPSVLLAQSDLASQPLLLAMLAIYDADGNALQRLGGNLGYAELYERILHRFAEREVAKRDTFLTDDEFAQSVQQELLRLSVVAFAMFNRHRQWTTEEELDRDLPTLLHELAPRGRRGGDLRAELSPSEQAVGRFFFVHQGGATRDGQALHTFEFLHATFGEYLLGRLVSTELTDMADVVRSSRHRTRATDVDDAFLHSILSFAPLTMRGTAVSFLSELIAQRPAEERDLLRQTLLTLFHRCLRPPHLSRYDEYEPTRLTVPARHAAYACNLVVLLLLVSGEVKARQLFEGRQLAFFDWRNLALLWRSQLPSEGWSGLMKLVTVERIRDGSHRDVRITLAPRHRPAPRFDPLWFYSDTPATTSQPGEFGWISHHPDDVFGHASFLTDRRVDLLAHALEPLAEAFPEAVVAFELGQDGVARSAANSLTGLLTLGLGDDDEALGRLYEECLVLACGAFGPAREPAQATYLRLVVRQLVVDAGRFPPTWRHRIAGEIRALFTPPASPSSEELLLALEKDLARVET